MVDRQPHWTRESSTRVTTCCGRVRKTFARSRSGPAHRTPAYLPAHTTSISHWERISASDFPPVNTLNVDNRRVILDNSLTFGGFHWHNPREIYVEVRYKFHY
jgi:hypothetical protein